MTHLFQRKATHQKRYGRFRSFRLAAGLVGINALQPRLAIFNLLLLASG